MFEIIWSEFAESQLDEIFDYYKKEAGVQIAQKHINAIIAEPLKLKNAPYIGQEEELLKQREIPYRYLVFKSYKIIYSVNETNKLIKITDAFDTHQYPPKIKRTK